MDRKSPLDTLRNDMFLFFFSFTVHFFGLHKFSADLSEILSVNNEFSHFDPLYDGTLLKNILLEKINLMIKDKELKQSKITSEPLELSEPPGLSRESALKRRLPQQPLGQHPSKR
jgi:hypothetical protein